MASRVMLHVGTPKTGTTYVQALLFDHALQLRDEGVLVPGEGRRTHARAATGARQGPGGRKYPSWRELLATVEDWPGTAVISNEWFSLATARQAERALRDLVGVETHIILTARDLVDHVPSAWQETLKLGESCPLDAFVASLSTRKDRWRWSVLDPADVLERWGTGVPPTHVHVVTLPPPGASRGLLWQRFAGVLGATADRYSTAGTFQRESLGVAAARLLERAGPELRAAVGADADPRQAYRWIQRYLSHELLAPMGGQRIALRADEAAMVRRRSHESVRRIREAGYHVAGDVSDLTSATVPPKGQHPDELADADLLNVAIPLLAALLGRVREEHLLVEELTANPDPDLEKPVPQLV